MISKLRIIYSAFSSVLSDAMSYSQLGTWIFRTRRISAIGFTTVRIDPPEGMADPQE
ncbi:hypothetical protein [Azospirillum argentinense]